MKISIENNALVTTPIYIGTQVDVEKASRCSHDFKPEGEPSKGGPSGKAILQMERCKFCWAQRTRVTPAEGGSIEDLLKP